MKFSQFLIAVLLRYQQQSVISESNVIFNPGARQPALDFFLSFFSFPPTAQSAVKLRGVGTVRTSTMR